MRRWEAIPDLKFAELIDGVVCMPSPVSSDHNGFHLTFAAWLATYADETPGCDAGLEATWLMGEKNVPQPDLALHILPKHVANHEEKANILPARRSSSWKWPSPAAAAILALS
jgi:hypothetical protein